ncbi:MAG: SCO family protein [Solirubrobacteraceae bacterium]
MTAPRLTPWRPSPLAAAACTTILAATVAAVAIVVILSGAATGRVVSSGVRFDGPLFPAGVRTTPFSLTDQNGRRTTLAQYRERVIGLSFMYSHCRDTCPEMATEIRGALDELGARGREVPVLAISVDPAHDTPASAGAFLATEGLTGRMRFLIGSRRRLAPLWKRYGIGPESNARGRRYAFGHSSFVILIDRRGYERVGYPAGQLVPEDLAHDIRLLLAQPSVPARNATPGI